MKPVIFSTKMVQAILDGRKTMTRRIIKPQPKIVRKCRKGQIPVAYYNGEKWIKSKYQPGDILYVRETWAPCATINSWIDEANLYIYKADYTKQEVTWKWRPSIHMPKEAARLFLQVENVRVERLQDITEGDCYAEGIIKVPLGEEMGWAEEQWAIDKYSHLWDILNAKRGYGWDVNPWVWVIEFERMVDNHDRT